MNNSTTNTAEYSMGGESSVALFANIIASDSAAQKLVDPDLLDVAENLVTDDSLVLTPGSHSQKNVTLAQLNLKPLALYTKTPANSGTTKTIGLGQGSIARDYYSELPIAVGALPSSYHPMGSLSLPTVDQRGVARVQGAAYDVGAYEGPAATICTPGVLGTVKFGANSARLSSSSKKKLRTYANDIVSSGCTAITLKGYTATSGSVTKRSHAIRAALSKARTKAVRTYLKKRLTSAGVSVTFDLKVYGKKNPTKSNQSAKGKAANRRVVIVLANVLD